MNMPHCTHVPHRQSPDRAWPLRCADGRTFAQRKREPRQIELPLERAQ
jgi:hypothetical protein